MPKTYVALVDLGALSDQYLNMMFVNMFRNLVPARIQGALLDGFLCEGWRVSLRFALGLFFLFKREIKAAKSDNNNFRTAPEFWKYIERKAAESPAFFDSLPSVAYKIPHRTMQWILRPVVVSGNGIRDGLLNTTVRRRTSSADLLMFDLQTGSVSPSKKASGMKQMNDAAQTISSDKLQQQDPHVVERLVQQSVILGDEEKARFLVSTLPMGMQLKGLEMVFNTRTDGFDLGTLYSKMAYIEECVFVIQTVGESTEQPGETIGAFMTSAVLPPNTKVKGSGLNYVFSVTSKQKYAWTDSNADSSNDVSPGMLAAAQQYAIFAPDHFSFGASYKNATNAIRIDDQLHHCVCGESDTYKNPILLSGKVSGNQCQAEILELEVYCPMGDLAKAMKKR
jgi:hypothetical protein